MRKITKLQIIAGILVVVPFTLIIILAMNPGNITNFIPFASIIRSNERSLLLVSSIIAAILSLIDFKKNTPVSLVIIVLALVELLNVTQTFCGSC